MSAPFQRCGCVAKSAEDLTNDFIKQLESGRITPAHMAAVLYSMHNALADRFEPVAMWMPTDLESAADDLIKAIRIDEGQPSPEDQQREVFRQCDEEGARQRYASRLEVA